MPQTQYIILRKTVFRESSLVVSGISPAYGRLDFMLKGALGHGSKKFPYAGLFRELSLDFQIKNNDSTLFYMKNPEPISNYDRIADYPEFYLLICEYVRSLLKHIRPMLEMPQTYQSLKIMLQRMSSGQGDPFDLSAAELVFMRESGLLPEIPDSDLQRCDTLEQIQEYGLDPAMKRPAFQSDYKDRLIQWTVSLRKYMEQ